jgi:RimJ/RimL family protein N-acetyltransferase
MLLRMDDGRRVFVRPIAPGDKALLQDGLQRLSPESVRRRFLGAKTQLSPAELRYLTEVDGRDHIALVALDAGDPSALVGVARCVRSPEAPDSAEMAIVVGDDWQGLGLGHALAHELAGTAARAGVRRFTAVVLADNLGAQRLLSRIAVAMQAGLPEGGVRRLVAELPPARAS